MAGLGRILLLLTKNIIATTLAAAWGLLAGHAHSSSTYVALTMVLLGTGIIIVFAGREPAPQLNRGRGGGSDYYKSWWLNDESRLFIAITGCQLAPQDSPAVQLRQINMSGADDHCLYRAFAHFVYGNQSHHGALRIAIAGAFMRHKDMDSPLRRAADLDRGDEPFFDYVGRIRLGEGDLRKGGPNEMIAYSTEYRRRIEVFRPGIVDGTYHLCYSYGDSNLPTDKLLYTGNHFDVLVVMPEEPFLTVVNRKENRKRRQKNREQRERNRQHEIQQTHAIPPRPLSPRATPKRIPVKSVLSTSAEPNYARAPSASAFTPLSLDIMNLDDFPPLQTSKVPFPISTRSYSPETPEHSNRCNGRRNQQDP